MGNFGGLGARWLASLLLLAFFSSAYADEDCVVSTYALPDTALTYIDIRLFLKAGDELSSAVIDLPFSQLLRSHAFQSKAVVLIDAHRSIKSKEELCRALKQSGYTNVRFLRESALDLKWNDKRLVLKVLPKNGWRLIAPEDVHQLLGRVEYLPVYLGGNGGETGLPSGFSVVSGADQLATLIRESRGRQIVVFSEQGEVARNFSQERHSANLWWVEGGLDAYKTYQSELTLSLLQRTNRFRVCGN